MQPTPPKNRAILVISSICLAAGILVVCLGIGVSVTVNNANSDSNSGVAAVATGAGVGYMIALALPLIIPSILGIVAGHKQDNKGLHIAYLVLVIISIIWLFAQTVGLILIAVGLTYLTIGVSSNPNLSFQNADAYYTLYGIYMASAVFCLICWCLELAGSILSCCILCGSDPQPIGGGQTVVVTTNTAGGYPATAGYAPPYDAKA